MLVRMWYKESTPYVTHAIEAYVGFALVGLDDEFLHAQENLSSICELMHCGVKILSF